MTDFTAFFRAATGHAPYDWQGRLACGEACRAQDPASHAGTPCASRLISIPTGLGKTAGVLLARLWNRVAHPDKPQRWHIHLLPCFGEALRGPSDLAAPGGPSLRLWILRAGRSRIQR